MNITKDTRVGVLMGGLSSEREISLRSGRAIAGALEERGYNIEAIEVGRNLPARLLEHSIEVAFNALHGKWGEDGCVQGLLEVMGIPYTGSGVTPSALCMDKSASKKIFAAAGVSTPAFIDVHLPEKNINQAVAEVSVPFMYPVVVKPADEGSSVGVTIVQDEEGLQSALLTGGEHSKHLIVEQFIKGREISVAILDDEPLGTVEIRTKREFYDYRAKYTKGETEYLVPAHLDDVVARRLMDEAARAHRVTGCEGVTRVDLILDQDVHGHVLEVNTLPGMTELSLVPQIAEKAGMSFADLCEKILLGARLKVEGEARA